MKYKFNIILNWIVVISIVFVILNLIHLVWYYMRPEGFWGGWYFLKILMLFVPGTLLVLMIIGISIQAILTLFKDFPNNFSWRSILIGSAKILVISLVFAFNIFQTQYFELSLFSKLADKYRDLKDSEEYVLKREFVKALKSADVAKERAFDDRTPLPIFILTRLYASSNDAQRLKADEEFSATINYAYCQSQFDSLEQNSINSYEKALEIAYNPLLSDKPGYKVYPLAALVNLYNSQGEFGKADDYNITLFEQIGKADKEDIIRFIVNQEIIAYQSLSIGDQNTASSIFISNHNMYNNADLDNDNSTYLHILLNAASGSLFRNDLLMAGTLLEEGEKLANKRKDKNIYFEFLLAKAKFCDEASVQNFGEEFLLNRGFFRSVVAFFSSNSDLNEKYRLEAINTYRELIQKGEDGYGLESIEYLRCLNYFADYLVEHQQYSDAIKTYQKILTSDKKLLDSNPEFVDKISLSKFFCSAIQNTGNIKTSKLNKIEEKIYYKAENRLIYFAENERESYVNRIQQNIQNINTLLLSNPSADNSIRLYNNILATKNILLYTNQYLREALVDSGNIAMRNEYVKILEEKEANEGNEIKLLIREKKMIRRLRSSKGFAPYNPRQVKWESVRNELEPNTLAVEYMVAPDLSLRSKPNTYYALVIHRESDAPRLHRLCTEDSLLLLLKKGGTLKQSTDSIYTHALPLIKKILLNPIVGDLESVKSVKLSLAGFLHQISFPAMLEGSGIEFEILGSTRLLADVSTSDMLTKQATIFGDIEYGTMEKRDKAIRIPLRIGFGKLPFSARELTDVKELLEANQYSTRVFRGKEATVQRFYELSGQRNSIIHLATHGIYDRVAKDESKTQVESRKFFQTDKSMAKCELVFAGVNISGNNGRAGIVTAFEISRLDLSKTELVVLSSCESGLGDLKDFEGVQGFQRAFTLAGVKNTVVSLWSVSDEHTAELMKYFYTNLMAGGSKHDALLKAQSKMKKIYEDPYYWAGFVLIRG